MEWHITRDKFLSKEEQDRLLKATEEKAIIDFAKGRSRWVKRWMLIDLALFSGLRVFEMASLKISDIKLNGAEKTIYVRNGKGGKSGYVVIDNTLSKHIKEFIAWKKTAGEPTDAEAPLLASRKAGTPYTTRALREQFKESAENAGLPNHYTIHSLRHTFATYLLSETKNIRLVQKQLRHNSPAITAVYADITPEEMTDAMESLRTDGRSPKKSKNLTCGLCKKNIKKPAKQLTIDGREINICPVCCAEL